MLAQHINEDILFVKSIILHTCTAGLSDLLWVKGSQRPACMSSHLRLLLHSRA